MFLPIDLSRQVRANLVYDSDNVKERSSDEVVSTKHTTKFSQVLAYPALPNSWRELCGGALSVLRTHNTSAPFV